MKTRERMMVPRAEPRTYYDRPVLKKPVWKWYVPAYFFTGGLAGASSTLAWAARLRGNDRLARRAALVSLANVAVSPALLIADLGRPGRFANMLRVAKPYRSGRASRAAKAANPLLAFGAGLVASGRRRARAGAAMVVAGVLLTRWSIFQAGFDSAEDPTFTVKPQRDRLRTS